MYYCENCTKKESCTKTIGMLYGYCNTDYKATQERLKLEQAVYDIMTTDMELVQEYSDLDIRLAIMEQDNETLLGYLKEVLL